MVSTDLLSSFDVKRIREDFPVLHQEVNKKQLVYFDNAATTQKPKVVLDALQAYYRQDNANIHRGLHTLAERATAAFEETRNTVQKLLNAAHREEIIFTKGTTDSINLVASSFGRHFISKGDEIIISGMEHHSNIVPWQMLCEEKGAILKVIPVSDAGELDVEAFEKLLSPRTRLVAVVYVSNALGTINPVKKIIASARNTGAYILLDGAQATSHLEIDVQDLDCDFFAFSAHKLYGPTGVGVLYGKKALLDAMPPYQGGGEMIKEVTFEKTTWNELPYKFEAGTPNIADVVAFNAAIQYLNQISKPAIAAHEHALLSYATQALLQIPGTRLVGQAAQKIAVLSFVVEGVHPQDLGVLLDNFGIAVRTGHHCTQPLMKRFGIPGTVRASFAMYNTLEEVDYFMTSLEKAIGMLA